MVSGFTEKYDRYFQLSNEVKKRTKDSYITVWLRKKARQLLYTYWVVQCAKGLEQREELFMTSSCIFYITVWLPR